METPKEIKKILAQDSLTWFCKKPRDKYKRIIDSDGYKKLEHQVVWEKYNGKKPLGSVIHHINEIKDDNRIENLMLFPNSTAHMNYHKQLRRERNNFNEVKKTLNGHFMERGDKK